MEVFPSEAYCYRIILSKIKRDVWEKERKFFYQKKEALRQIRWIQKASFFLSLLQYHGHFYQADDQQVGWIIEIEKPFLRFSRSPAPVRLLPIIKKQDGKAGRRRAGRGEDCMNQASTGLKEVRRR